MLGNSNNYRMLPVSGCSQSQNCYCRVKTVLRLLQLLLVLLYTELNTESEVMAEIALLKLQDLDMWHIDKGRETQPVNVGPVTRVSRPLLALTVLGWIMEGKR